MLLLIYIALAGSLCKAQADISRIIKHQYPVCSVRFSADGKYLAIAGGQAILIWDMEKDRRFKGRFVGFWMSAMDFASHGNYLSVGGNSVVTEIYKIEKVHKKPVERLVSDMVGFIDFSPDGNWLASGANDKDVILWDISSLADSDIQAVDATGKLATTWGKLKNAGMAK